MTKREVGVLCKVAVMMTGETQDADYVESTSMTNFTPSFRVSF